MTYLRLVPVASRRAAGVSGARRGERDGRRRDLGVGRAGVGEVRLRGRRSGRRARVRGRRPAGSRPRAPPRPSGGGAATASDRLETIHRRARAGSRSGGAVPARTGRADRAPSRTEAAIGDEPLDEGRSSGCGRGALDRRPRAGAPWPRPRGPRPARRRRPRERRVRRRREVRRPSTSGARSGAPIDPMQIEPRGAVDRGTVAGTRPPRPSAADPLGRLPPARDPAGRDRIEHDRPDDPIGARTRRRSTSRSPGATAIGAASRRIATRRSVGQVDRVAAAPPDARVDRRPSRDGRRTRARSGKAPVTSRDEDADRWRRPLGSSVRTRPRCSAVASTPARLSAVRPGPAASTVAPWTWTSRTADGPAARHEAEGRATGERSAAQRAGHDDARDP